MELRKDYVLERWVVIAEARKQRPKEYAEKQSERSGAVCFFCPGNEALTPPEIGRLGGKKWKFRWFPNKFPAVDKGGKPSVKNDNTFFTFSDAYGSHEIIVETPSKTRQLWDLNQKELAELFGIYRKRINALSGDGSTKYVAVFKNHGSRGGASLKHSHTQVASLNIIPPLVQAEVNASTKGGCAYCRIIEIEKGSLRRCFENNGAVAFAPYASRFNYEIWIFPKRHIMALNGFSGQELNDFTALLKSVLKKLRKLNVSYNYVLHYAPADSGLHFHVEVSPRIATWAGFEIATDMVINSVPPEEAAKFYRGESQF